jgi:hypothetical protein
MMHSGSCLCGAVRYEVHGELGPITVCHCRKCRKANGSAFNGVAPIAREHLKLLSGQDALAEFESSPGVHRVFCKGCGAQLYSRRDAIPETLRLRLGTLDTPIEGKPAMHIFTAYKAEWYDISGDAPQHQEHAPA